jgi:FtsP/CotA-like multicopper oxidase with cupredoxin domain
MEGTARAWWNYTNTILGETYWLHPFSSFGVSIPNSNKPEEALPLF